MEENPVVELVIDGGDGGGKTIGIADSKERLAKMGYRVFVVPEVASIIIESGIHDIEGLTKENPEKYYQVEKQMLLINLDFRKRFRALAAAFPKEKRIIIYDRSPMHPFAFVPPEMKKRLLEDCDLDVCQLRDTFDGVIHMTTAVKGAEHGYTRANNQARQLRSFEELRAIDDRLMREWLGAPHFRIVGSTANFDDKLDRLFKVVCHFAGIPQKLEIERKFLLKKGLPDFWNIQRNPHYETFYLEQIYLTHFVQKQSLRIRRRFSPESKTALYFETSKEKVGPGIRQEHERLISESEYLCRSHQKEPNTAIVRKTLYCFVHKNQVFEAHVISDPIKLNLLEIELLDENEPVELPPFLEIDREVTHDPRYTNHAIARGSLSAV